MRGGEMLHHNNHRFVQYLWRDHVGHYRCTKITLKCRAKIKIDEKMKYAEQTGKHNHKVGDAQEPSKPAAIANIKSEAQQSKTKSKPIPIAPIPIAPFSSPSESGDTLFKEDLVFNKDVTSEVELITNDREVTLMFLRGYKFTKYFDNKTHTSYRCVSYTKQATDCQARIKHNSEYGEVLMRSEHNHPSDQNAYEAFLNTAVKVRKFTKKKLRHSIDTASASSLMKAPSDLDVIQDIGDFALAMSRIRNNSSLGLNSSLDQSLLVEVKAEKKD